MSDEPGMTVDGDVLAEAIIDACPDVLNVDASIDIAERALAHCVHKGMTVLRGPDAAPWTPGDGS